MRSRILDGLGVTAARVQKGVAILRQQFDDVERRLASSSSGYLVGDGFTAADMSFACMAAPILLVQARCASLCAVAVVLLRCRALCCAYVCVGSWAPCVAIHCSPSADLSSVKP